MSGDTVHANGGRGIHLGVGATGSTIAKNKASGSTIDLVDDSANCGSNIWTKNKFGTSEANGVSTPACIE